MDNSKSHHVRLSGTVLDSGIQAMDSGFQLLYSEFLVSGTNSIPHTNGFRDSGFVKLYYGFHMKIFPHSRIRITLNGAIRRNHCNEGTVCLLT